MARHWWLFFSNSLLNERGLIEGAAMDKSFVRTLDDKKLKEYYAVLQRMLEEAAGEIERRGINGEYSRL